MRLTGTVGVGVSSRPQALHKIFSSRPVDLRFLASAYDGFSHVYSFLEQIGTLRNFGLFVPPNACFSPRNAFPKQPPTMLSYSLDSSTKVPQVPSPIEVSSSSLSSSFLLI